MKKGTMNSYRRKNKYNIFLKEGSVTMERKFCEHCGSAMEPDDIFCPSCGQRISDTDTNIEETIP